MIPVTLESPWKGDIERNEKYLQECIKHCIYLNEAPFASHWMYTKALNDSNSHERAIGIQAGYGWMQYASAVVFYIDYGMSSGMHNALDAALALGKEITFRKLRKE